MLRTSTRTFEIMGVIVMCIANGACGAARPRPEGVKETVIFEENFERGNLARWDVQGGKAEVIREGGSHICRIVSGQMKRRGPEDESIRWDDTAEGAFIYADLPAEKLHDKRVYIHCRYKLLDPAKDNDWVGLTIVHIDAKTGEKSWCGGPILESKDPNVWTEARLMADMVEKVADTRLRVGFGRASGTLLIDSIRLTVTSKTPPDRADEAIADNSGAADAVRLVRLPDGCAAGELLYENRFSGGEAERKAEAARDWVMEGGGIAEWKEGFLRMIPKRFTKGRSRVETDHFVYWLKRDFPADFAIEWDFRVPDLGGLAIIFICAKGINGEDIFDPKLQKREGVFGRYFAGDINCYHVSYYAGGRGRANVRRNPGFYLVMAGDDLVVSGGAEKWHRLSLTRFGSMLELSVNGKRCLTWFDDGKSYGPVHGGGKIGLRQQNDLRWGDYTNLRVYELKK
jgi:hypothetical protein